MEIYDATTPHLLATHTQRKHYVPLQTIAVIGNFRAATEAKGQNRLERSDLRFSTFKANKCSDQVVPSSNEG